MHHQPLCLTQRQSLEHVHTIAARVAADHAAAEAHARKLQAELTEREAAVVREREARADRERALGEKARRREDNKSRRKEEKEARLASKAEF